MQGKNTQNDVFNEPWFILSLVLQHAKVIFGKGGCSFLPRCLRNNKCDEKVETACMDSISLFTCGAGAPVLPLCDVSRLLT